MSEPERLLIAASASDPGTEPAPDARSYRRQSSWPVARLPALLLMGILALTVTGPTVVHDLSAPLWPVLLVPALLATLAARLAFESAGSGSGKLRTRILALGAVTGAFTAAVLISAAAAVLGLGTKLVVELVTLVLTALVLAAAGAMRDLEIRMRLALRRVYFAGTADSLAELRHELVRSPEASLVGAVGPRSPLGSEVLAEAIRDARATVLVLDRDAARAPAMAAAAAELRRHGIRIRDLLSYYESEFKKVPLTELTPAWFLFEAPHHGRRSAANVSRRVVMVATAALLAVLSAPVVALLMLAVRLTSPGPAIFRQTRVGKDGSRFTLIKLRTMWVDDGEAISARGAAWATAQDHRITPLGRVLRRYRLDELPQLWNVLRGELALVGPRPEQVPIVEQLEREIPFYAARHTVRPGLTGWAQVNLGYSGSVEGARAKLQRDLYYVKHRSLRLDLLILWLTLKAVFSDPRVG